MSFAHGDRELESGGLRPDALASGVVLLVVVTVVQRSVGFVRSMLFCRLLEDEQLGRWSLLLGFLSTAAPLAVLGLPGTFGRYVEHYRLRGQLARLVRRTTLASAAGLAVILAAIVAWPRPVAWLVFGDPSLVAPLRWLPLGLAAIVAGNFATELLLALRQVRASTWAQLASSLLFAGLGIGLLAATSLAEQGVLLAFAVSSLVPCGVAWLVLVRSRQLPAITPDAAHGDSFWGKLLPFAAWVCVANLLASLFDAADRYMIVHFAPGGRSVAESLVGQYHASRVVPVLLVSLAGMISGVLLPYLSHEWERGRRDEVSRRVGLAVKLVALAFAGAGVAIRGCAPVLFGVLLGGKYDAGLAVLPWTLLACIWFAVTMTAQDYLWCAEKARLGSAALAVGLAANIGLNALLLPRWGLLGAVAATAVGNLVALALVLVLGRRHGLRIDTGLVLACLLPLVQLVDPVPAGGILVCAVLAAALGAGLLSDDERLAVQDAAGALWQRWRSARGARVEGVRL